MRSSLLFCLCLLTLLSSCNLFKKSSKVTNEEQSSQPIYLDTATEAQFGFDTGPVETNPYRPSRTRKNDLLHTILHLKFDYAKQHVLGRATLSFKPYFYPVNTLELDAKGFDIHKVRLESQASKDSLLYDYDGKILNIHLNRTYNHNETYQVYIEYTAKPNETPSGGGLSITEEKGLYFINPTGREPNKPRQIWTQGETQSNSRWFPTIDAPNEKMTQEFYLTVDSADVTLSNGELVYSNKNNNGTRTDCWKMNLPHAPYLAMIAVGKFKIVKDTWRDSVDVNYYVEPEYEPYAKLVFGNTPEMIEFFSRKLGVDFVWPKYAQIVVRDFVSGAMENTTAVVFYSPLQHDSREHLDNTNENVISHELFHHWFGDLVTAESWANLSLNESFATYGEYLWNEYKYGRDEADHGLQEDFSAYQNEYYGQYGMNPTIINYHYDTDEKMFNAHSYQKGGRVLHMLRKYVGDSAFFKALNQYLVKYKFGTAELSNLRMEFEDVTGEDLNWFFTQWYLNSGHPDLGLSHSYDELTKELKLTVSQNQVSEQPYILPVTVDIYTGDTVLRKTITVSERYQDYTWTVPAMPKLVNFDAERMLLATRNNIQSREEWAFQYLHAPLYEDRYEALMNLPAISMVAEGMDFAFHGDDGRDSLREYIISRALSDPFWAIRLQAVEETFNYSDSAFKGIQARIEQMAMKDPRATVRAAALESLAQAHTKTVKEFLLKATNDSSYEVVTTALSYLYPFSPEEALKIARSFRNTKNSSLLGAIASVIADTGDRSDVSFFGNAFLKANEDTRGEILAHFSSYLKRMPADIVLGSIKTLEDLYQTYTDNETRRGVLNVLMMQQAVNDEKIASLRALDLKEGDAGQKEAQAELLLHTMLGGELQKIMDRLEKPEMLFKH